MARSSATATYDFEDRTSVMSGPPLSGSCGTGHVAKIDVPLLESYCRNVVLARGARVERARWRSSDEQCGQLLAAPS